MRKRPSIIAVALVSMMLAPASAFAWGAVAHRYIAQRVIELLPAELKPLFVRNADEFVLRSNDPDLWRLYFQEEIPNHQIDFGVADYGPYPFSVLPREYGAAIEKFGTETLKRHGTLPWRIVDTFGYARRVMESFRTRFQYAPGNTVLSTAVLGHYLADAYEPFHVYNNYDGQMTGQNGIHSRFESELFERFQSRLSIAPPSMAPVTDPNAAVWDIVLAAYQLNAPILQADREAIAGRDTYDDEYFEKFFAKVKPILERQLAGSIASTVAFITGAWEQAGRPEIKVVLPRPVQRVRTPK